MLVVGWVFVGMRMARQMAPGPGSHTYVLVTPKFRRSELSTDCSVGKRVEYCWKAVEVMEGQVWDYQQKFGMACAAPDSTRGWTRTRL